VYLLEAADDICYALIDLEDGLLLGMLPYDKVEPILLQLIGDYGTPSELTGDTPIEQKLAALRGRAMKRLVDTVSDAFARNEDLLLTGAMQGSLLNYCPADIADGIAKAKALARDYIFTHPNKARLELFAGASLHHLLNAFIPLAAQPGKPLRFSEKRILLILNYHGAVFGSNIYDNIMQVLDMITSLSDHQAYAMSQELSGQKMALMP
jgi:dGTPase